MDFSAMTTEQLILLAVDYVAEDLPIPDGIKSILGPTLITDLENPESTDVKTTKRNDGANQR